MEKHLFSNVVLRHISGNEIRSYFSQSSKLLILLTFTFFVKLLNAQTVVTLPTSGAATPVPAGTTALIYDNGGAAGNYTANVSGYVYLTAMPGYAITITGNYDTESCCDKFKIFSGNGTATNLVNVGGTVNYYTYTGTVGQGLTVQLTSDGSVQYTGMKMLVTYSVLPTALTPTTGNNSIACGTNTILYDNSGVGSATYYAANSSGYTVLTATSTAVIRLMGTFYTESCCDNVKIYAGVGTAGTLLQTYAGTGAIDYTGTAGQTLTVKFTSDGSVNYQGFALAALYSGSCGCTPALPSAIVGTLNPEVGSTQTYSVTSVASTTYAWSLPAGWTITSGQGTNTITATVGTANGTISVTPSNGCGAGPAQTATTTIPQYRWKYISSNLGSTTWCGGETRNVSITIKNTGTGNWADGAGVDFNVGVKWNPWTDYFVRVDAQGLNPGATGTFTFPVRASNATAGPAYGVDLAAGSYTMVFDIVKEACFWFAGNTSNGCGTASGNTVFTSASQTVTSCACSGTPTPGNTNASALGVASGGSSTLSLQYSTAGTGVTYQWQSASSSTGPWNNISGATASTYTATVTATTWFQCIVSCSTTSTSATSNAVQVQVLNSVNVPSTGSNLVNCGSSTLIYDNGGGSGDYVANSNGYTVLDNSGTGVITISGSYTYMETSYDYLRIYSGVGTGGTLLYTYNGSTGGTITSYTSPAGTPITIQFTSDGSGQGAGFALTATYSGACASCSAGPNSLVGSVTSTTTATISWTAASPAPTSGYDYYLSTSATAPTGATTPTGSTASTSLSLTGLTADATYYIWVRSNCGSGQVSNWVSASFITSLMVPSTGNNSYTLCSGTLYDAGGAAGNYNINWNGYTVIYPGTVGSFASVSGASGGESCCDYIYIYNGVGTGGTLLWSGYAGLGTIPTTTSTSGPLTIQFTSDGSVVGTGFALTIACVAPPSITSISASPACQGSTVTITGSGFTGITSVQFNGLAATSFTVNSATSITAVIPATATSGNVTVTNVLGTASQALTVNASPAAPLLSAVSSSFCGSGGTTAITASGSTGSYSWSSLEGSPSLSASTGSTINATLTQTSAIQVIGTGGSCPSLPASISIGVYPLPGATMSATPNNFCLGTGTTVNVASGLAAGNFSSVAIPHAPRTAPVNASVLCNAGLGTPEPQGSFGVSYDDGGWANIPIGFSYDFFGTNYSTLNVGTNGNVMFGAFNATSLADFTFTSLPNTTEPYNMVAILAMDNILSGADGGTVKYWTEGYAPNRRFIVSYENVREYGDTKYSTSQAIFYETTGVIEVHVTSSTNADRVKVVGVNNGDGTIGVQALAQTPAITTSVAYRFTPPANYTTVWYANGVQMGASATNVFTQTGLTPTATTTYSIDYTNQTTGCSNDPVNAAVPVTVNTLTLATTPTNGDVIWRGATSTDWNTASNWFAHNGTTYAVATAVPTSANRTIIPANQTCVLAQPAVNITTAGSAKDVIIETGATLTMTTGTLNVSGNFVNNGTFVAGTGKVAFNAVGTVSGNATTFNDVDLNNGVNFGAALSTITGIMTMNTGSWVNTNPPTYGNASLLKYNTGGTYGRGFEWSATTGPGYPNDVQVANNTTINYPNTGGAFSTNQKIRGNLTIDAGSNLYMDYGTLNASSQLTVLGNVNIAGDLSLGNQIGGDLRVGGNWTHTTGNFYHNNREVVFNGNSGNQTITKAGGETFAYFKVNKAAGNVILANNVTTIGGVTLTSGLVEVGTNNFVMGSSSLTGGSATSYVKTASTGILSRNVAGTTTTFPVGNTTYNPAMLTNTGTADVFSMRVIDNVTTDGTGVGATTAEAVVKRTWMIDEASAGGSSATVRLYWNGAGEEINAFAPTNAFVAHYVSASNMWDNIGNAAGAGYVQSIDPITSFSPFTISSSPAFAPLPVELISLGAQCSNEDVIVSWSTASEHNTLNFIVERSENGLNWNEVQTVAAAMNSNTVREYAIADAGAARGLKYYRLIQTDQDGVQKVYGPVMSNCGSDEDLFMSFPNPSDADITLVFNSKKINGSTTLMVRDAHGRVVRSIALEIQPGTDSILVPDMELTPGVYYLQLEGESFKTPVIKHSLR